MALINEIEIHVINEHLTYANQVSEHPIENEANITDHVKKQPISFELTGIVVDGLGGKTAGTIKEAIKGFMDKAEVVKYSGRNAVSMCLITNFATDHDAEIANGFRFTMSLRILQRAKISVAEVPVYEEDKYETEPINNVGPITLRDDQYTKKPYYYLYPTTEGEIIEGDAKDSQIVSGNKKYYLRYIYDPMFNRKIIELLDSNKECLETTSAELGNIIFKTHLPYPFKVIDPPGNSGELLSEYNLLYLEVMKD